MSNAARHGPLQDKHLLNGHEAQSPGGAGANTCLVGVIVTEIAFIGTLGQHKRDNLAAAQTFASMAEHIPEQARLSRHGVTRHAGDRVVGTGINTLTAARTGGGNHERAVIAAFKGILGTRLYTLGANTTLATGVKDIKAINQGAVEVESLVPVATDTCLLTNPTTGRTEARRPHEQLRAAQQPMTYRLSQIAGAGLIFVYRSVMAVATLDHHAQMRLKAGPVADQLVEIGGREGQNVRGCHGADTSSVRLASEQGHLAKKIAFTEGRHRLPVLLNQHLAMLNQVEGIRRAALGDQRTATAKTDRLEDTGQSQTLHRQELAKQRDASQSRFDHTPLVDVA